MGRRKGGNSSGIILILGGITVVLILRGKKKAVQKLKNAEQLSLFPIIRCLYIRLYFLLGAGMTSKAAWFRIISDYNRNLKEGGKQRYVCTKK